MLLFILFLISFSVRATEGGRRANNRTVDFRLVYRAEQLLAKIKILYLSQYIQNLDYHLNVVHIMKTHL